MIRQTIDILTSYETPKKVCVMGNIAVARGAIEAGVCGVFSYPGTPSTEISEVFNYVNEFQIKERNQEKYPEQTKHQIYFEFSINEKVALEKAIAYSIGNKGALCVMKNVGMNVACDALMSITYQTIIAPLVIIVCDDPGCFSSSNEQDSRYWGRFASVPMFNPSTPDEALTMTKKAFDLSQRLKLPVIVRMTTRVNHSRGMITYNSFNTVESKGVFERMPQHINIPARTATAHKTLLNKLLPLQSFDVDNQTKKNSASSSIAIITSGVADVYARELLSRNDKAANIPILKLGMIYPFPEQEVLNFLNQDFDKILVLEELDPIVENEIRVVAQKNNINTEILGKGSYNLSVCGEYNLDIIRGALEEFTSLSLSRNNIQPLKGIEELMAGLPPRPPALCAGCPHRATFYALKLAVPRNNGQVILCGDIGCNGLGALPPLQMIDTINHMGMSVSMAQGLSEALQIPIKKGKVVAMLGDGTFFHSGVASLLNAIYTRANITVIVFDNRTIGMTGHQDHPGAPQHSKYKMVDIIQLVKGMGVDFAETMYPFDLKDTFSKINKAVSHEGVSVLVAKASCIFLPEFKDGAPLRKHLKVDPQKCNTCFNHADMDLYCSREKSAHGNLLRARLKIESGKQIAGSEQLCPANICNHGFFNAILGGSYKEALEIVRDKMLFAKVCGQICHKPCESSYTGTLENGKAIKAKVPIKRLKNFISSMDENFHDSTLQVHRAKHHERINKKVAIIGAGPAGLSAAYDLIQAGYEIEIFEKENAPGGMLNYIIPDFRVDKNGLMEEIDVLQKMGAVFHYNSALGKDITIDQLSKDFDAVIIAIGMWASPTLDIVDKNVPNEMRFDAINFLKKYNSKNLSIKPNSSILVIGGGNSAMDAAMAAKKYGANNKVVISCIESLDKMPAFPDEIAGALSEGIDLMDNSFADSISMNGNIDVVLKSFDKKDNPQSMKFDYIITAIGQKGSEEIVLAKGIETDNSNRIKSISGYKNVFFAGDIAAGNHNSLIGAIGSGKKAAVSVRKLIEDYKFDYEGELALQKLATNNSNQKEEPFIGNDEELLEYINDFNLYQPCHKCDHCLKNFGCPAMIKVDGKIVIDDIKCTRCGLCIDVCPNNAIDWMEVERVEA